MDHADHVSLLRDGVAQSGGTWGDFGAGAGAFTLALAELLGAGAEIHAVDRDGRALRRNADAMNRMFPRIEMVYHEADFTTAIPVPPLDGIVMANSLHFQRDQIAVVKTLRKYLGDGGRLVVVEYNIERANAAVPYPVPFAAFGVMAKEADFRHVEMLARRPSRTFGEIYSAAAW